MQTRASMPGTRQNTSFLQGGKRLALWSLEQFSSSLLASGLEKTAMQWVFHKNLLVFNRKYTRKAIPHREPLYKAQVLKFSTYSPKEVESKWQKLWQEHAKELRQLHVHNKGKYYVLSMFPYPSGSLHLGHARVYTISDTLARMHRMAGYKVLHPMGWDAFGLPAENAAIERGVVPHDWTMNNIAHMKRQLLTLGYSFDWDSELTTCSPQYYKWTQWIFLQLFKHNLAYQKEAFVNWDPVDQTVLADEQVDALGRSWRSGAKVERKLMKQWFLKITHYAEALSNDLDMLTEWPENVKKMQKEWINKTAGAIIDFKLTGTNEKVRIFTTRPDTLMGVTFLAIAPEHPLVARITPSHQFEDVRQFSKQCSQLTELERKDPNRPKHGLKLDVNAIHPITQKQIPIFIADYVIADYGTGAIMGVPAHDIRDWQFANQHKLSLVSVIIPPTQQLDHKEAVLPYNGKGILINSGKYDGLTSEQATDAILRDAKAGGYGDSHIIYNLRDWLISRQRYWGTPIPIIYCAYCGTVPVPEKDLPVLLPTENVHFKGRKSPLPEYTEWINVRCPSCGGPAKRETDTMDTFVDSSWYYLRYLDPNNVNEIFDRKIVKEWMPVDIYVGGIEHAILHLLYARFINKFLYDLGLVETKEPFRALRTQGMVHGKTYKIPQTGKYIPMTEVEERDGKFYLKATEIELEVSWEKMSKSKYNGVDPENVIALYGADTVRLFLLFKAPLDFVIEWDTNSIQGQQRWLHRVWSLVETYKLLKNQQTSSEVILTAEQQKTIKKLNCLIHETIRDVTTDISVNHTFNTAIARLMRLSNILSETLFDNTQKMTKPAAEAKTYNLGTGDENNSEKSYTKVNRAVLNSDTFLFGLKTLLLLLTPMAPHFACEVWHNLVNGDQEINVKSSAIAQPWPTFNQEALQYDTVELVVQVNGKVRGTVTIPADLTEEEVKAAALNSEIGKRFLKSKEIIKVVVAPTRKLISFVIK